MNTDSTSAPAQQEKAGTAEAKLPSWKLLNSK